ncbi:uncharacterized protein [Rutidosis leptorrhynchoides]|uniref:uncharacterized protein n=1 Tax=Rutidosis leptorrhynchoides TaxID=125765 RepID=UPI003A9A0A60
MKVIVKTLKGTHFEIEVKLEDTVADVKKIIETVQGSNVYPAAQQMLIHQGKVLKDGTTLEENKVVENSFIVVMISKSKSSSAETSTPAPTPAPVVASPQVPATVTQPASVPSSIPTSEPIQNVSSGNVYGDAASNLVAGNNLEGAIQQILDMGGGTWDRDTVVRALRAAFNNPERAVDYLYSGIPESAQLPPVAGPPPVPAVNPPVQPPQATQPAAAPPTGPNANPLNLFPQGLPDMGATAAAGTGAGAGGNLDFLRNNQQFQALRAMVQANPQILQPMLQELGKQNPQLVRLIQEHQADFLRLINEPVEGGEDLLGQLAGGMPQTVTVTPEEGEAIERLEAMGFDRALVLEVFFACNKNEELAANYLLDHMHEFEDYWGAGIATAGDDAWVVKSPDPQLTVVQKKKSRTKMSLVDDSPVNSSSSDDFAAFLDTELDSVSDTSSDVKDITNEILSDINRTKRQKIEVMESVTEIIDLTSQDETTQTLDVLVNEDTCTHPGVMGGMCIKCGEKMNCESGIPLAYVHKDLRLAKDEMERLRNTDLKNSKKLILVLDLDHTLLNSTHIMDVCQEEGYLMNPSDPMQDALKSSLFKLPRMNMMTKLRPFVHDFLKEASKLFEMYIYTMGKREYAKEMAILLDPQKVYFGSRVIAQNDCTEEHRKGLDVVLGQESAILVIDDTEGVWVKHKENLILIERYLFFASSCKQFGYKCKSLSELKSDESKVDGSLATVLQVLKKIHKKFFDPELDENIAVRDVRQVLGAVRCEVLKGCKVVFSRVFPTKFPAENHQLWKMAERLGAICATEVDPSVTHVISTDTGTEKSHWAVHHKKYLVEPRWLEAAYLLWQRQSEEQFPVKETKKQ